MRIYTVGSIKLTYRICLLLLAAIFGLSTPVFALHMTEMSKDKQTKVREPRERAISLKLPLQQPVFHWAFKSRKDFLSGKLLLRIIRNGQAADIVIFENGRFSDGWEVMPWRQGPDRGEIYFGFISTRKYLTAPGDKLELELTAAKDLAGVGPSQTGILPAGKYVSRGTYSGLIDEYDTTFWAEELAKEAKRTPDEQNALLSKMREQVEHKAFLESWLDQWPLKITGQKGWLPDEQASPVEPMPKKPTMRAESPSAAADAVVTDENLFRKYLWFWIAIPLVVLFIVMLLRRASGRR